MHIHNQISFSYALTNASRACRVITAAVGYLLWSPFWPSIVAVQATEIVVSCGTENAAKTIKTKSRLQNVEAIHVKIDAADNCRVDVSYRLRPDAGTFQSVRIRAPDHAQPRRMASTSRHRCFVLGGRSFCE
jgi:hypothetical protein